MPKASAATAKATTTTAATAKKGKSTTTKAKAAPTANSIFPNLPGGASTTPAPEDKSRKRKTNDAADKSTSKPSAAKRPRTEADDEKMQTLERAQRVAPKSASKPATKAAPKSRSKVIINEAPKTPLHVYVFGEGSSGELGLGAAKNAIDVKRPRLNAYLPADKVGVVHVACGGMHVAALSRDGNVLTWGVNDQGALGRNTQWEGGMRDMDDDSDDDDNAGLNPRESTPGPITTFPEGTVIVKLSAGDSHTLALTDDGRVFGWGTFRVSHSLILFRFWHI